MNKLIVFGSTGMLGSYIHSYFKSKIPVITVNRDTYDAMSNRIDDLKDIFEKYCVDSNTVVFNAVGTIPQATKDQNIDNSTYIWVNSMFPSALASLCKFYGAHLIHPTTDCVYTGVIGSYRETDPHDASDLYGSSKSLGEPKDCTVIRCSIIGEELRNKRSLVEWVKSNKDGEINGYTNHYWNGITCLQYAKLVEEIISRGDYWKGVRHIISPNSVSKYDLVSMINEAYKLNIKIKPHETEEKCDRTLASIHNQSYKIHPLEEQIREMAEYDLEQRVYI